MRTSYLNSYNFTRGDDSEGNVQHLPVLRFVYFEESSC